MLATRRRLTPPLAVAALALALFAGCAPTPVATTEPTGPNPGTPPPAGPTVAPPTGATSTPVTQTCNDLVSPDTMYDFNPNFGLLDDFTPAKSSAGARATQYKGLACRWQNQTSGEVVDLSVAHFDAGTTASLHETAAKGTAVPALGDAFFTSEGSVGAVTVFNSGYWIVLESPYFGTGEDATTLVASVTGALTP
ncbi:MAG TPA: hypothetical protein VNT53_06845 [Pseudolysinimonas sp.]|nr:hypothetical protein [Pseudolysinimonas sp.]